MLVIVYFLNPRLLEGARCALRVRPATSLLEGVARGRRYAFSNYVVGSPLFRSNSCRVSTNPADGFVVVCNRF